MAKSVIAGLFAARDIEWDAVRRSGNALDAPWCRWDCGRGRWTGSVERLGPRRKRIEMSVLVKRAGGHHGATTFIYARTYRRRDAVLESHNDERRAGLLDIAVDVFGLTALACFGDRRTPPQAEIPFGGLARHHAVAHCKPCVRAFGHKCVFGQAAAPGQRSCDAKKRRGDRMMSHPQDFPVSNPPPIIERSLDQSVNGAVLEKLASLWPVSAGPKGAG